MRHLNGVYTQTVNRRHGHSGYVFQGRYKAIPVNGVRHSWHSVKPQTPRKAGCRMGGAPRYPSSMRAALIGIAALHPTYRRDVGA